MEFARLLVSIPLLIGEALWDWWVGDDLDELIAHHDRIFISQHEGE